MVWDAKPEHQKRPDGDAKESMLRQLLDYLACYICWLAATALLSLIVLMLLRNLLLELLPRIGAWATPLTMAAFILAGLGWLIAVLAFEMYLRGGLEQGWFWTRVRAILASELIILALLRLWQLRLPY